MSTLKVNKIIPTAGVPTGGGGGIIQVVTKTETFESNVTTTSTSYTNLTSTLNTFITPLFSSSKILVIMTAPVYASNSYNGGIASFAIGRNGSTISGDDYSAGDIYQNASGAAYQNLTMHAVDSPNTTSQTGYNFMCRTNSSSNAIGIGAYGRNELVTITLMEISA